MSAIAAKGQAVTVSRVIRLGMLQIVAAFFLALLQPGFVFAAEVAAPKPVASGTADYQLGVDDKLRVTVFGEDDLSGQFVVDGSGYVRLPLIGEVKAVGLSVRDFETQVESHLRGGYLKNPRVNVEVTTYRPFYILGQVNRPGKYDYVNDMTVLSAVALAGGYTYRASDTYVYIRRNGQMKEDKVTVDQAAKVHPGDTIRVPERFF